MRKFTALSGYSETAKCCQLSQATAARQAAFGCIPQLPVVQLQPAGPPSLLTAGNLGFTDIQLWLTMTADPFTPDQLAWLEARYRASISTPSSWIWPSWGYGRGLLFYPPWKKGRMGVTIVQTYGEYIVLI